MTGAVVKVEPVGLRRAGAFVHRSSGCSMEMVDIPVYPPHPEGRVLSAARRALGLGLREASKRLGLSAEIVSGLEWGRYRFVDDEDWGRARDAIAEAP